MVNFASIQAGANAAWNAVVSYAKHVPFLTETVTYLWKNAIATPVQGLASLAGRAAVPARDELKQSALFFAVSGAVGGLAYYRGRAFATAVVQYTGIAATFEKHFLTPARKAATEATRAANEAVSEASSLQGDNVLSAVERLKKLANTAKTTADTLSGYVTFVPTNILDAVNSEIAAGKAAADKAFAKADELGSAAASANDTQKDGQ